MAQSTPIIWSFNPGKFATKNSVSAPNGERKDTEAFPSVIAPLGQVDDLGLGGSRMLTAYERDQIRHVRGTHTVLERALHRFLIKKPYDLADAAFWSWDDLAQGGTPGL
jgi:hypothetical protein